MSMRARITTPGERCISTTRLGHRDKALVLSGGDENAMDLSNADCMFGLTTRLNGVHPMLRILTTLKEATRLREEFGRPVNEATRLREEFRIPFNEATRVQVEIYRASTYLRCMILLPVTKYYETASCLAFADSVCSSTCRSDDGAMVMRAPGTFQQRMLAL